MQRPEYVLIQCEREAPCWYRIQCTAASDQVCQRVQKCNLVVPEGRTKPEHASAAFLQNVQWRQNATNGRDELLFLLCDRLENDLIRLLLAVSDPADISFLRRCDSAGKHSSHAVPGNVSCLPSAQMYRYNLGSTTEMLSRDSGLLLEHLMVSSRRNRRESPSDSPSESTDAMRSCCARLVTPAAPEAGELLAGALEGYLDEEAAVELRVCWRFT